MKLLLLGTTGYHPSASRHTACFMFPELGLILDAGSAMFRVRNAVCTPTLDIYLTHAHLDHTFGLTFLFDVMHGKNIERITVHGRPQDLKAVDEHLLAPPLFPVKLPMQMEPLPNEPWPVAGGGTMQSIPLTHPGGSVGYRIDWPGKSFAYITDTTAVDNAEYLPFISGVDLLIHECYFDDSMAEWAKTTGHSCTTPVATLAKRAGVGRLILVHLNPIDGLLDPVGLDVARRIFPNTDIAEDETEIEF